MKKRPILIGSTGFVLIMLVGAAGLTGAVTCWRMPHAKEFAADTSPDGKYRCVVTHHAPGGLKESPQVFEFNLMETASGKPLPGKELVVDCDSTVMASLDFRWSGGKCVVTEKEPGRRVMTCDFGGGDQRWSGK